MTNKERAEQAYRELTNVTPYNGFDWELEQRRLVIEQAITAAVEEKDKRIAALDAALRIFEDGANWEVYPGLRDLPIYEWRHDSDPRVLAQDARSIASGHSA